MVKFVRNLKLDRFNVTADSGKVIPFERKESQSWETKF